jgi:hypothetical protein
MDHSTESLAVDGTVRTSTAQPTLPRLLLRYLATEEELAAELFLGATFAAGRSGSICRCRVGRFSGRGRGSV